MTKQQIELVQSSFQLVQPILEPAAMSTRRPPWHHRSRSRPPTCSLPRGPLPAHIV